MAHGQCQFKLVLLGDTGVGKSSLVLRFVKNEFNEGIESTIGAAFLSQTVIVDNWTVKFEIWDTAGQERYLSLAPMYYRGAAAAVIVYDITSRDSFARAQTWTDELRAKGNPNAIVALAGNKFDRQQNRQVERDEAATYATENDLLFFETSAKTNMNVTEIFYEIAEKLPKKVKSTTGPIKLEKVSLGDEKTKKKCCK